MNDDRNSVSFEQKARIATLKTAAARALAGGEPKRCIELLREALTLDDKGDPMLWLSMAAASSALADEAGALAALESVLALDPRSFFALLMKGSLQDRRGETKAAALTYGAALTQTPPVDQLDEPTRRALARAQSVNRRYIEELRSFVKTAVAGGNRGTGAAEARRIDLFIDTTLGVRRAYRQQPTEFNYPGLPAIEFYERTEFPWLEELEQSTADIHDELQVVFGSSEGFTPYVAYPAGVPLDQWAELNHSPRWSAFHFYHYGRRFDENCARCPKTLAALAKLPQPQVTGRMPAAMFSVLRAGTRIPPHTGVANVRLVGHLPLIVPPHCGFRVGHQRREWKAGEAWVFDDTIEHEAWNESTQDRVILIFDLWSPRLDDSERDSIAAVMAAIDQYNGVVPDSSI